jgi:hypothetical protein
LCGGITGQARNSLSIPNLYSLYTQSVPHTYLMLFNLLRYLCRDKDSGEFKGDGLVTYLKEPSVLLATQILDGATLRESGEWGGVSGWMGQAGVAGACAGWQVGGHG